MTPIQNFLNCIHSGKIPGNSTVISCQKQKKGCFPQTFRIPLGIFCGDLPCSFKITLPFLYHPKLTWCYCTFNSTLTITFHYTDSSISIIDNAILAYTLWDPSIYLQSTHLCVRYRYTLFLKELSPTYFHVPVQTTKIIFLMTDKEFT